MTASDCLLLCQIVMAQDTSGMDSQAISMFMGNECYSVCVFVHHTLARAGSALFNAVNDEPLARTICETLIDHITDVVA